VTGSTGKPGMSRAAAGKSGAGAPAAGGAAARPRLVHTERGVVASDAQPKTRRVVIERQSRHPKYGKLVTTRTVLHAHDEANESKRGDTVEVQACRPVSATKRWRVTKVLERASGA